MAKIHQFWWNLTKQDEKMRPEKILIVDDDDAHLATVGMILEGQYRFDTAHSGEEALELLKNQSIDLVVLDFMMPGGMNGLTTLKHIKTYWPNTEVVFTTVVDDPENIVEAIKAGAFDYIIKGFAPEDLLNKINNALEGARIKQKLQHIADPDGISLFGEMLIGPSLRSRKLLEELAFAAGTSATCLLIGETGTGKDLAARYIHKNSDRRNQIFVPVNLPALPANLIESILFGHEKGSFTGALRSQIGKFEFANKGTILLDEIGDLSIEHQVKLLRVIETGEIERIGCNDKNSGRGSNHCRNFKKLGRAR
ncbi:MAG: sigma-54 dependent transcriptional regulator [Deltaproteobacteria bacterium]|nr:sigma-54 dependent transcriptional regulator [Deltaproteobacteria bacterium]